MARGYLLLKNPAMEFFFSDGAGLVQQPGSGGETHYRMWDGDDTITFPASRLVVARIGTGERPFEFNEEEETLEDLVQREAK